MPCSSTYCLSNTGYPTFDDVYFSAGTHNSELYWTGQTNGLFIYYNTGSTQWCLSTVLNGTCLLSGQSPCFNPCPDLDDVYFSIGACPTPTPTPTLNCANLNFSSIFDCDFETTPTPTITSTTILTPTPTPTPTKVCNVVISATIQSVTPNPTPTPTFTPTPSAQIARTCTFYSAVTFNTIDDSIVCPYSYEFQSCYDGDFYWTTKLLVTPSNLPLEVGQIYQANVITNEYPNGIVMCIGYRGINNNVIGINDITIISESYGIIDGADCIYCSESIIPTPTPTPTPTASGISSQCVDCGLEGYLYSYSILNPTPTSTPTSTSTSTPTPTPTSTSTPTPTPTPTLGGLTSFAGCGYGNSVSAACNDAGINSRTLYSDCDSGTFGVECFVYVNNVPNALTGYTNVFMNSTCWDINSLTGDVTASSSVQC